jgi:hypothetical protein
LITGNPDSLTLKIGLNACVQLPTTGLLCASSIPGLHTILPWYVLSGTYSFGDICHNNRTGVVEATVKKTHKETTTVTIIEKEKVIIDKVKNEGEEELIMTTLMIDQA